MYIIFYSPNHPFYFHGLYSYNLLMKANSGTYNIGICGLGFLALYFAYSTVQNFLSQTLEQLGYSQLGFYMLALMCISMCAISLFSGPLPVLLGPAKLMASSAFFVNIFNLGFLHPVYCHYFESQSAFCNKSLIAAQLLFVSVLAAYGFTALWVGQGAYLRLCATEGNSGSLQGLFWFCLQWSQILGNFVASLILTSPAMQLVFFTGLFGCGLISVIVLYFLPMPSESKSEQISKESIKFEQTFEEIKQSIQSTFALLVKKKMVMLYPNMIYSGMIGAYFCGMVPVLAQDAMIRNGETNRIEINQETGIMMIFFGISDAFAGLLCGKLMNIFGKKFGMFLILAVGVLTMGYTYFVVYYVPFGCAWWFIEFGLGFCDGSVNPLLTAICASEFTEKSEPFCVSILVKCFSCFASYIGLARLRYSEPIIPIIFILIFCILGYIGSILFPFGELENLNENGNNTIKNDYQRELLSIETAGK